MKKRSLIFSAILPLLAFPQGAKSEKPRLVVQIVVSQMRYDYLERFGANFSEKGLRTFIRQGAFFTDCRYDYMLTGTASSLATLTTGSMPSTHGVVGGHWIDFVNGKSVHLVEDPSVCGLECDASRGCYSPMELVVPTLGDMLLEESQGSRVVTVASSPLSAVVMGGFTGEVYWCDESRGKWITSSAYADKMPAWVVAYNGTNPANHYLDAQWNLLLDRSKYVNKRYSAVNIPYDTRLKKVGLFSDLFKKEEFSKDFHKIYHTPAGNTLVKDFAKKAIVNCDLGQDMQPDLLNICFDASRHVGELFGPESMEVEDMLYRLDADLADLLEWIESLVGKDKTVIVLTSDHGASDSYDRGDKQPRDRFNIPQFKVIMNGFMNAQWGSGDWVLGYCDRQLYLNRDLIYRKGLSLEEVQNRVAAFALQFRGVSHAMTSTALSSSAFASGYGRLMQNSFYPRRSGDVVLNLMPGWIEERDEVRSLSGSMYDYDTHVPLMVIGGGITSQRIRAPVDPVQIAPTLARLMHINRPVAATGDDIEELTQYEPI